MTLNIGKTYEAIRAAAKETRFLTYGEVAAASGVEWNKARRPIPQHLDQLVKISHERGWPLLSAIVVNKENVETGELAGESLAGFLSAVEKIGIAVEDPKIFLKQQQRAVFDWADSAPEHLFDVPVDSPNGSAGPRFVHYFNPVLDALRSLGGSAAPESVYDWIRGQIQVPLEELEGVNKGGQSKFHNKVAWARFYLAKAGLIDASKRGVWALTPEGVNTTLSHADALQIFRRIQNQFKTSANDEEEAPDLISTEELFADPDRRFWFVGAAWGGTDDQTPRFLADGIWQNGFHNKFADEVKSMKPGDKIAIKAAFVRKNNLPFDNLGKSVSCMRIKAIGTITENAGDGKTVRVAWEALEPPRDWFFYTYRVTLVEADRNDDLARKLIAFTFVGRKQDYDFWINEVPYFAKKYGPVARPANDEDLLADEETESEEEAAAPSYTIDNIAEDGCFLAPEQLADIFGRIQSKKNLVLQGPPGTGKTWLAKRLAYAMLGSRDPKVTRDRMRVVQFHPSLSYEDFVRGWRPSVAGKLELIDGLFLEIVEAAKAEPDRPFVLVIEEINRGNPAQIFGEILTLLEDTKRSRDEAMELAYRREPGERVFVPKNLHVIGTMNIADRSLALVDLALRRRFAFVTLEPTLNELWRAWCGERSGMPTDAITLVKQRIDELNDEIENDRSLGPQYRVGHSYVTPPAGLMAENVESWFGNVVRTEIVPLLEEYWFDAPDKVKAAKHKLLAGF